MDAKSFLLFYFCSFKMCTAVSPISSLIYNNLFFPLDLLQESLHDLFQDSLLDLLRDLVQDLFQNFLQDLLQDSHQDPFQDHVQDLFQDIIILMFHHNTGTFIF